MTNQQMHHPANTENTLQECKAAPKDKATTCETLQQDNKSQDVIRPPPKTSGDYHSMSMVQDMVDGDIVQAKILDLLITLPLKEHEHTTMTITMEPINITYTMQPTW